MNQSPFPESQVALPAATIPVTIRADVADPATTQLRVSERTGALRAFLSINEAHPRSQLHRISACEQMVRTLSDNDQSDFRPQHLNTMNDPPAVAEAIIDYINDPWRNDGTCRILQRELNAFLGAPGRIYSPSVSKYRQDMRLLSHLAEEGYGLIDIGQAIILRNMQAYPPPL